MSGAGNSFWRYSLRTYRAPGVQEACLALQERCGADVNLLLFCGWTGRGGRALDEPVLRSAVDRVGRWQSEVIAPLRLARRGLKRHAAGLEELASQWTPPAQRVPPRQAIAANLACYLELLDKPAGPDELAQLGCIAQACAGEARRQAAYA